MQALALEHHRRGEHAEHAVDEQRRDRRRRGPRIANSSPPSRATVSPARRALRRRSPQISSSRSPAAWPSESLTCLKSSRSRKATTAGSPAASVSAIRCSNSARFGRPVSESSNASRLQLVVAQATAAGAVEQREQRGQPDDQRATITTTVPIQEIRSLRSASFAVALGGGAQAVADPRRSRRRRRSPRRARSRAHASARTPPRSRAGSRRTGAGPRRAAAAAARRRASSPCMSCSSVVTSAWTASGTRRSAFASDSSASTRLASASSPRAPRSGRALVGVQVQRGDAERRRRRDERDDGGDQDRSPAMHSPRGGRPADARLYRFMRPESPW